MVTSLRISLSIHLIKRHIRKGHWFRALYSSSTMVEHPVVTGFTLPAIQKQETWLLAGKKQTRPVWVSILSGLGHGQSTEELFTIGPRLIWKVILAIQRGLCSSGT